MVKVIAMIILSIALKDAIFPIVDCLVENEITQKSLIKGIQFGIGFLVTTYLTLCIYVHEIGHAFFILICGGRIEKFYVRRGEGGVQPSYRKKPSLLKRNLVVLGGPLFNFLFYILASEYLPEYKCFFLGMNCIGILQLIPKDFGDGTYSDGFHILFDRDDEGVVLFSYSRNI